MELTETGKVIYERTYSRIKPDGEQETWPETVARVVDGNLALSPDRFKQTLGERADLIRMITQFKLIPAGRHLWACGVPGAQHLMNCWASGFTDVPSRHFAETFGRLMEGGGVGANYSNKHMSTEQLIKRFLRVHIVCDPEHKDYDRMREAGILSTEYDSGWAGSFAVEDSREGWADALTDLIDTFYRDEVIHRDRVYDVSRVRPAGAKLKTFGGTASGPLPLGKMLQDVSDVFNARFDPGIPDFLDGLSAMEIDHAIAQCVVAGGVRRSARMAMMHWEDPQIFDFIEIKKRTGSHWTTNISVEVDADFWKHANPDGRCVDLQRSLHASKVLRLLSEGAVHNGEPGIWDSTVSNVGEPTEILVTNPCGEIGLVSSEPCNLGHVNLAAFVDPVSGWVDWEDLERAHRLMTRFLIRATFAPVSDPESRRILDRNRRIGVGHTGVASFLAMTGQKYSDVRNNWEFKDLLTDLSLEVDDAAIQYAHSLRIPVPVKKRTVAPTGTISKMPGVSEGIHPIFSRYFIRRIRFSVEDERQAQMLRDYWDQGYLVEPDLYADNANVVSIATKDTLVEATAKIWGESEAERLVESADELTLHELLTMQYVYQTYWADNAVSFTANVDPDRYTPEEVRTELLHFGGHLKGTTIFPEASMPQAPYERITKEEFDAAFAKAVADGVDENCANGSCPIR